MSPAASGSPHTLSAAAMAGPRAGCFCRPPASRSFCEALLVLQFCPKGGALVEGLGSEKGWSLDDETEGLWWGAGGKCTRRVRPVLMASA